MSKLVLGIDASRSAVNNKTGVETYSTEIISAILKNNKDFEIRLYTPKKIQKFPIKIQKPIPFPKFWTLIRLSFEMLVNKPDFLFVPAHVLPFFAPKKSFVTVHDVAFEKIPAKYPAFKRFYLKWSTKRAIKKCKKIIVPSNAVKKDLVLFYKAEPDQIEVIWHGIPSDISALSSDSMNKKLIHKLLAGHDVLENDLVFFYLGRIEHKKNVLFLLDAFSIVHKKFPRAKLFFAGGNGNAMNDLIKKISDNRLDKNIFYIGYLDDSKVLAFFKRANAFLSPSLEEGFGLPILQAFAAYCPVVCSSIPVFKEIFGDAVLYASPNNPNEFANSVIAIINDENLRNDLVKKGKARLKMFSWTNAGKKILQLCC